MDPVISDWLLEGDPAIRWQVHRDLLDAPENVWMREQALVATTSAPFPTGAAESAASRAGRISE